jgi:hypothetical protein
MPAPGSAFEFLFKYRRSVFDAGDVAIGTRSGAGLVMLVAALALLVSIWSYARPATRARLGRGGLMFVAVCRGLAILLATLSLLEPILRVMTVSPQQTFVGVVLDDSRSLTIMDEKGRARSEFMQRLLDPAGDLRQALEAKFKLRFFRFSEQAERIQGGGLGFGGVRTDLAIALKRATEELADVPVSGLIIASDGADNVAGPLSETLLDLRTRQVPVFAVGLGLEDFDRDVEITRVEAPASALQGSTVVASVAVKARGAGKGPVRLTVEDSGRLLASEEAEVSAADSSTVRVAIRADEPGPRLLRFKASAVPGEQVAENNHFDVAIDVLGRREKILYFEGGARFEAKFLRRAVQDDKNLQVVTLERTSDNKFLRLDVDSGEELAAGFPKSREELFGYRGLILGGVEASFFTVDQLRMISDFVSERGGGLLMIGSDKTFAEGGYAGTVVADTLPVVLDAPEATRSGPSRPGDRPEGLFQSLKVTVTPLGAAQPVTQLAATSSESETRFRGLPLLSSVNGVTRVKPGALTLLSGEPEDGDGAENASRVVLAFQRYGRGRAFAFPVIDSWRWQMHADVAVDDMAHETFWRQMLRQLVSGAGGPVSVALSSALSTPGTPVTIRADVSDETFIRVNDAVVVATVQGPDGLSRDVNLHWSVDKDGEYVGEFRPDERGVHQVRTTARRAGKTLGEDTTHVRVEDSQMEFRGAEMKAERLKRIATETRGRFYTSDTVTHLPDDLTYSPATASVVEERELWDMPFLFLGILFCLSTEWVYRKYRGLV